MPKRHTPFNARFLFPALLILFFATLALACLPQIQSFLPASNPTQTVLSRGEQLYNANCLVCHGGATGGAMMDYPPKHNANGHTWHHPDCELTEVILNGRNEMTDMMRTMMNIPDSIPRMLPWKDKLSNDDIAAILAYIKTMWTEDERRAQASITQQRC